MELRGGDAGGLVTERCEKLWPAKDLTGPRFWRSVMASFSIEQILWLPHVISVARGSRPRSLIRGGYLTEFNESFIGPVRYKRPA